MQAVRSLLSADRGVEGHRIDTQSHAPRPLFLSFLKPRLRITNVLTIGLSYDRPAFVILACGWRQSDVARTTHLPASTSTFINKEPVPIQSLLWNFQQTAGFQHDWNPNWNCSVPFKDSRHCKSKTRRHLGRGQCANISHVQAVGLFKISRMAHWFCESYWAREYGPIIAFPWARGWAQVWYLWYKVQRSHQGN